MITVRIPLTDENYTAAPFDSDTIKGPVRDWLRTHIHGYWNWEAEPTRYGRGQAATWKLAFRFTDPHDATLFKLTWGGV